MFVSGVEPGFWPSDFVFLGAKSMTPPSYLCFHRRKCFDQFTFTMLNTVDFVGPISTAILRTLLPAA
jgi:hypothetical protein